MEPTITELVNMLLAVAIETDGAFVTCKVCKATDHGAKLNHQHNCRLKAVVKWLKQSILKGQT